ncbi:trace amine-associated receptor 1-like [Chiloscyllium punctatum]|uniref:trace amine-associated receptor 1-like n=1 Tax=Chiloscyllium punctatum TaxID=137246 RepID=UPI003B63BE2B
MYIFILLIILCTLIGNMLLIISILHFKQLHMPTNYLILSLATADFLLGCFVMPYSMMRSVEMCWYFGQLFCKIHSSCDIMLSTASLLHLCFISVDRYYAMCDPLRYKIRITFFSVQIMIIVSWAVSASFAFVLIFLKLNLKGMGEGYNINFACYGSCVLVFSEISGVVASTVAFYIPGITMLCIYFKIYFVARKQVRNINKIASQVQNIKNSKTRFAQSHERKAAKTLGMVLGIFLICWSPFFISNTIDAFINYSIPPVLFDAFVWFGYMNSMFNPLIYGFFFSWFRKAVKIICKGQIFQPVSSRMDLYHD